MLGEFVYVPHLKKHGQIVHIENNWFILCAKGIPLGSDRSQRRSHTSMFRREDFTIIPSINRNIWNAVSSIPSSTDHHPPFVRFRRFDVPEFYRTYTGTVIAREEGTLEVSTEDGDTFTIYVSQVLDDTRHGAKRRMGEEDAMDIVDESSKRYHSSSPTLGQYIVSNLGMGQVVHVNSSANVCTVMKSGSILGEAPCSAFTHVILNVPRYPVGMTVSYVTTNGINRGVILRYADNTFYIVAADDGSTHAILHEQIQSPPMELMEQFKRFLI